MIIIIIRSCEAIHFCNILHALYVLSNTGGRLHIVVLTNPPDVSNTNHQACLLDTTIYMPPLLLILICVRRICIRRVILNFKVHA